MRSRRQPTIDIPVVRLPVPEDVRLNDTLVYLYQKLHRGEVDSALTRVHISAITSGFCERKGSGNVVVSNIKEEYIPGMERLIRGGSRTLLDLYWSPLAPGGGGYVCADDETVLAAYSRLNFGWVQCRVLRPKKVKASEASIWLEKHGDGVRFKKAVAPAVDNYKSFVGHGFPPFCDIKL